MNNQNYATASRMWLRLVLALSLFGTALVTQAQTAIESVSGSIQSGVEVVRIDLSQALSAVPAGFSIQSPARIALDFPGVTNVMGRSTIEINQGNLDKFVDLSAYPRQTSDIVALLVVQHQVEVQNRLVRLNYDSRKLLAANSKTNDETDRKRK